MTFAMTIKPFSFRFAALTVLAAALVGGAPEARADIFKPSKQEQIKLGEEARQEVLREYRVVNDSRTRRLNRIAENLLERLPQNQREPWQWRFHLIDSKEVNAFALPGGNIFIYTGLYERMRSDDEVAAVLGHEMAHVYHEHWARQVSGATKRQLGLAVLLGLTRANKTWQDVASVGLSLTNLRYSRGDEDQSDASGLTNMHRAGYDPRGMLDLFRTLQGAGGGGGTPEFLRSHPLTSQRIRKTEERISKLR